MLSWARASRIHLINVHEIFHRDRPMTLHRQYTAEHAKQLPRGYAGASDHLRLDIIHLLGGTYLDGDNHLTTTTDGHPPALTQLLDAVAASPHGFTLHMLPGGINNDLIIAPARHPAITLWRELARGSYLFTQRDIFGGLEKMARQYIGRSADQLLRYTVPMRAARLMGCFSAVWRSAVDERMVRAAPAITHGSELSWSHPAPPPPPAPLTPTQITATLTRATTTLARQLTTREGNLHLTAIDPLITTLPDPDAAWTAIITLLAELTTTLPIPPATSITQFRWNDDGTPHHVTLPPEAEAHITRTPHPDTTWLLDEAVTPAGLTTRSQATVANAVIELAGGSTEVGRRVRRGRASGRRGRGLLRQRELRGELARGSPGQYRRAGAPPAPWGKVPEGASLTPAGEVIAARTAAWLRRAVGAPVLTPGYETELARRTGPDLFGLLRLPDPPPLPRRGPPRSPPPRATSRPSLRLISMTRPAPEPADLSPAALNTDPGPVSAYHRTPAQRRWEQPRRRPRPARPTPPSPTSSTASGSAGRPG